MTNATVPGIRQRLAFTLPGIVMAFYLFSFSREGGMAVRLIYAGLGGALSSALWALGVGVATVTADSLLGGADDSKLPPTRHLLAGMLLATAMFIWLQQERRDAIDLLIACVQTTAEEQEPMTPGQLKQAVLACYRQSSEDLFDE
jgi:hypothetical protein